MDKKHVTLLVFLDLSAAFDTVDHNILISRLKSSIGIRGNVFNWFSSYLMNKSQRVTYSYTYAYTLYNIHIHMENMERFTPLYAIMNGMENLHFGKEGYFKRVFVFYGLFYKRNTKHFPRCSHKL